MPNFATAADALTTALATVDSRLTNIDISSQLELYLDLIGRRASIQAAIAASGGGGSSSITSNTSIEYGVGASTAKTTRIAIATDANAVSYPDSRSSTTTLNSATLNAAFTLANPNGGSTVSFVVIGLTASGATLTIEASDDNGTSYAAVNGITPVTGALFSTFTTDRQFRVNAAGRNQIRVRISIVGTGNITVAGTVSNGVGAVMLSSPLPQLPPALGAQPSANSLSFVQATDIAPAYQSTATITRAANTTAYTANDTYGAAFELTGLGASGAFVMVTDIEIIFNISALPSGMAGFALYPYLVTPPSAIADNGAFSIPSGDRASVLSPNGISLSASLARGGGSVVAQANNLNLVYKLTGTSLFAYLVTLAAFTPAAVSETATIKVRALAL